ncbi:hypothetical protein [Aestuariivirga sp.]|uniref:hypothetical protein n=1 Tax=Aestuariivirga sp. TaxID=2650926 RepID=UPI0035948665
MNGNTPPRETYKLEGLVVNVTAPIILPSDMQRYLVFGFQSPTENRIINAVFYVRLGDANGPDMALNVVKALATEKPLRVTFTAPKGWSTDRDPSYVIDIAELV